MIIDNYPTNATLPLSHNYPLSSAITVQTPSNRTNMFDDELTMQRYSLSSTTVNCQQQHQLQQQRLQFNCNYDNHNCPHPQQQFDDLIINNTEKRFQESKTLFACKYSNHMNDDINHNDLNVLDIANIDFDNDDQMNSEKRKEKSRKAARERRSQEAKLFDNIEEILPVPAKILDHLDKASLVRIAINYLKIRSIIEPLNVKNNKQINDDDRKQAKYSSIINQLLFNNNSAIKNEIDAGGGDHQVNPIQQHQNQQQQTILNTINGFIFILSKNGDIIYMTENIEQYLGLNQIDLIGQSIYDYCHPCDHDDIKQFLSPLIDEFNNGCSTESNDNAGDGNGDDNAPSTSSSLLQSNDSKSSNNEPISSSSTASPSSASPYFIRMKCTLTSKGRNLNLKSATYKVIKFQGHMINLEKLNPKQSKLIGENYRHYMIVYGEMMIQNPIRLLELPLNNQAFISKHLPNMKFSYVDDCIEELFGYNVNELIGKSFYQYFDGNDCQHLSLLFKILFTKGQCDFGQYKFLHKLGGYRWIQTQATIIYETNSQRPQSIILIHQVISNIENGHLTTSDVQELCRRQQPAQQQQSIEPQQSQTKQKLINEIDQSQPLLKTIGNKINNNNNNIRLIIDHHQNSNNNQIPVQQQQRKQPIQQPPTITLNHSIVDSCTSSIIESSIKQQKLNNNNNNNHNHKQQPQYSIPSLSIPELINDIQQQPQSPPSSSTLSTLQFKLKIKKEDNKEEKQQIIDNQRNNCKQKEIVSSTTNQFISSTEQVLAPKTADMESGFLIFTEDNNGITVLNDADDLTHLAPDAGDLCVPMYPDMDFNDMNIFDEIFLNSTSFNITANADSIINNSSNSCSDNSNSNSNSLLSDDEFLLNNIINSNNNNNNHSQQFDDKLLLDNFTNQNSNMDFDLNSLSLKQKLPFINEFIDINNHQLINSNNNRLLNNHLFNNSNNNSHNNNNSQSINQHNDLIMSLKNSLKSSSSSSSLSNGLDCNSNDPFLSFTTSATINNSLNDDFSSNNNNNNLLLRQNFISSNLNNMNNNQNNGINNHSNNNNNDICNDTTLSFLNSNDSLMNCSTSSPSILSTSSSSSSSSSSTISSQFSPKSDNNNDSFLIGKLCDNNNSMMMLNDYINNNNNNNNHRHNNVNKDNDMDDDNDGKDLEMRAPFISIDDDYLLNDFPCSNLDDLFDWISSTNNVNSNRDSLSTNDDKSMLNGSKFDGMNDDSFNNNNNNNSNNNRQSQKNNKKSMTKSNGGCLEALLQNDQLLCNLKNKIYASSNQLLNQTQSNVNNNFNNNNNNNNSNNNPRQQFQQQMKQKQQQILDEHHLKQQQTKDNPITISTGLAATTKTSTTSSSAAAAVSSATSSTTMKRKNSNIYVYTAMTQTGEKKIKNLILTPDIPTQKLLQINTIGGNNDSTQSVSNGQTSIHHFVLTKNNELIPKVAFINQQQQQQQQQQFKFPKSSSINLASITTNHNNDNNQLNDLFIKENVFKKPRSTLSLSSSSSSSTAVTATSTTSSSSADLLNLKNFSSDSVLLNLLVNGSDLNNGYELISSNNSNTIANNNHNSNNNNGLSSSNSSSPLSSPYSSTLSSLSSSTTSSSSPSLFYSPISIKLSPSTTTLISTNNNHNNCFLVTANNN